MSYKIISADASHECPICWDSFTEKPEAVTNEKRNAETGTTSLFHPDCIKKWMNFLYDHNRDPSHSGTDLDVTRVNYNSVEKHRANTRRSWFLELDNAADSKDPLLFCDFLIKRPITTKLQLSVAIDYYMQQPKFLRSLAILKLLLQHGPLNADQYRDIIKNIAYASNNQQGHHPWINADLALRMLLDHQLITENCLAEVLPIMVENTSVPSMVEELLRQGQKVSEATLANAFFKGLEINRHQNAIAVNQTADDPFKDGLLRFGSVSMDYRGRALLHAIHRKYQDIVEQLVEGGRISEKHMDEAYTNLANSIDASNRKSKNDLKMMLSLLHNKQLPSLTKLRFLLTEAGRNAMLETPHPHWELTATNPQRDLDIQEMRMLFLNIVDTVLERISE